MHAQARRRVHFHHTAALFFKRAQNRFTHHVDAADVQPHHLRGGHRAGRHFGVHIVGHIGGRAAGGQIGVVAQVHALALVGHRIGVKALLAQTGQGDFIKADFGQRRGVPVAPARVLVDPLDQLRHGVHAIAGHAGRIAPCRSNQPFADHQQAEVIARHVTLHQHVVTKTRRHCIGCAQGGLVLDIDGHTLALVPVQRLDHHWQSDLLRRLPGIVGMAYRASTRHRHTGGVQ